LRNSDQVSDAAALTINGNGTLDLEFGNASETVGSVAGALASAIKLGPGSVLTTGDASNTIYAGTIQGAGGITKQGSGLWNLTGTSDYAGATTINAGTLAVNGTLRGTPVSVNTGGTLMGNGSVSTDRSGTEPAVTVNAGGTINAGSSPGILTTGTILGNGGNFVFELNGLTPGTGYDQISVVGLWNLNGNAALSVTLGFTPALGDKFFIGLNDGIEPVNGTFTGFPEGSQFPVGSTIFAISYQDNGDAGAAFNDISLAVVPEPGSLLLLAAGAIGLASRRRRKI
jgi:autotransporter-associated beta strand protein